ncbi:MAG: antitoxin [Pseudonocardiaceae bacterium]|nr:antitoxin [Pseudonocardia sp.]
MLGKLGKLVVLAGAVEGARRFAKANPEAAGKIVAGALGLVDQVTKGKLRGQIDGVVRKFQGGAKD